MFGPSLGVISGQKPKLSKIWLLLALNILFLAFLNSMKSWGQRKLKHITINKTC